MLNAGEGAESVVEAGLSERCCRVSDGAFAALVICAAEAGLSGGAVDERSGRRRRFLCTFLRSFSRISRFFDRSSEFSESEPMLSKSSIGELDDVDDGDMQNLFSASSGATSESRGDVRVSIVIALDAE